MFLLCALASACTSLNGGESEGGKDSGISGRGGRGGRGQDAGSVQRDSGRESDPRDGATASDARMDSGDRGPGSTPEPSACELDAAACPMCKHDDDCAGTQPCRTTRCNLQAGRCESTPRRDGVTCALGAGESGVCAEGRCAQCVDADDCTPTQLTCRRAVCTSEHACSTEPRAKGSPCSGGFCNEQAECVECALDENCASNQVCTDQRCACKPGHVPNTGAAPGCNFDECAREDDHRCGGANSGNQCINTDDGYGCVCAPPWMASTTTKGPQCYQGGAGSAVTVTNGGTWNMSPGFDLVCSNVFADPPLPECPDDGSAKQRAHVTWLNVCGLVGPPGPGCKGLAAEGKGLLAAKLQRVTFGAALESIGEPSGIWAQRIDDPVPGDVILVQTLTTLGAMRITAVGLELGFEWASVWRDRCFVPGGQSCAAACDCPGGT